MLVSGTAVAGSLTPPGPPAPTFKTLSDIEPRTLIAPDGNSLDPVVIDQSGPNYLGRDVQALPEQDAITINANNVSLDLNGFSVRGNLEVMDGNTSFGIACAQGNALVTESISKHNDTANRLGCSVFNPEMP